MSYWRQGINIMTTSSSPKNRIPSPNTRRVGPTGVRWRNVLGQLPLVALASGACGSEADTKNNDDHTSATDTIPDESFAREDWESCPIGFIGQCSTHRLPIDWSGDHSSTLDVFVSQYPALSGQPDSQLWLIAGGPGDSGSMFHHVGAIESFAQLMPNTEFLVMEQRGIGHSTRLGCTAAESPSSAGGVSIVPDELPGCAEEVETAWGEDLRHFSTSAAAHDLAYFLDHYEQPGARRFIMGLSYGTSLAQAVLDLAPDRLDGVVLDSIMATSGVSVSRYDTYSDGTLQDIAGYCVADPVCSQHMGEDPWLRIQTIADRLRAGHCQESGLSSQLFSGAGAQLLRDRVLRQHLLPLLHRLDRCNADDVAVIQGYLTAIASRDDDDRGGNELPLDSPVLHNHIVVNEAWYPDDPVGEQLTIECDEMIICPRISAAVGRLAAFWPIYPADSSSGLPPQTGTPMLMLNGDLDPQTPHSVASMVADQYTGPHQHYVEVPFSPHIVVANSPMASEPGNVCGVGLLTQFVADEQAVLNLSCLDDLVPFAFSPTDELSMALFGEADVWGED